MPENVGEVKLQGSVTKPWVYQAFTVVFAVLFSGIVLLTIFANTNTFYNFSWYWLLLAATAGFAIMVLLCFLFGLIKKIEAHVEILLVAFVFALFITVQVLLGLSLQVVPNIDWDFGIVFTYAKDFVLHGTIAADDYFLLFPNNAGLYSFWCGFLGLLLQVGIVDFALPTLILNIICIDVSLLLLYLCVRRLFGAQKAIITLVCSLLLSAFTLYVPVYYTDTLTMPFPIGAVLLWLVARGRFLAGKKTQGIIYFCVMSAFVALGGIVKITVIIVWLAVVLDLLLYVRAKGRLWALLAGTALAAVVLVGGMWLSRNNSMLPKNDYTKSIPASHWVMMGLNGYGGYEDDDYKLTLTQPDMKTRAELNKEEIGKRISQMGAAGVLTHLGAKISYTFGDGTFYSAEKLFRAPTKITALHEYFIKSGMYFKYTAYISYAVWAACLVCVVMAAVRAFIRKNYALIFVRVALFGLVIFLLLWETRSRYLVNFLPLFILASIEAAPMPVPLPQRRFARQKLIYKREEKADEEVKQDELPVQKTEPDNMEKTATASLPAQTASLQQEKKKDLFDNIRQNK